MITDDQVEEVRARADVVDIVGEMVPLKRSGRNYMGKCPFHEDSSPSFSVVPGKGYRCFGCGESGDVFSFVMKRMGMDFPEAVRWVAGKVGVEIREVRRREGEEDPMAPYHEANAFAADHFRRALLDDEVGAAARSYLEGRGITPQVAERFLMGFAPDEWRSLRDAAVRHGMEDSLLLDVGLTTVGEKGGEPYDRFRNRIIFPIEGIGGRVVAFGGRLLGKDGGPKYLNSPETPVYHKGEVLYGLHKARHPIRKEEAVLVVEGYMDLVSLAAAGVEHVVATLGTATTSEQARLLARYTRKAILLFDSDAAGLKAAFRGADVLLAEGVHPMVVTLPDGEDPDTLVRKEGVEGLRRHLDGAVDVVDRKLQILRERGYLSTIEGTRSAVDRLLPSLRATRDPALRDIYTARVAEATGIRRETLESELQGGPPVAGRGGGTGGTDSGVRRRDAPRRPLVTPAVPALGAERDLLRLLVRDRDWIERAAERVGLEEFLDPAYRAIFLALTMDPSLRHPPPGMDPGAAKRLEQLLADPHELGHPMEVFEASVGRMSGRAMEARIEELDRRIEEAPDLEAKLELMREKDRLRRESRGGRVDWLSAGRRAAGFRSSH